MNIKAGSVLLICAWTSSGAWAAVDAPLSYTPQVSTNRPVVLLHGYGNDCSAWDTFRSGFSEKGYKTDDSLAFSYYYDTGVGGCCASGLDALACDYSTPIQDIAEKVAANTRIWLRRRAGLADDDASHDDELPAPDWVAHSMGGLVFRCLYYSHPELVHRCADLGTPHFGQPISWEWFAGYQTVQMQYGASFLWNVGSEWNFCGKAFRDVIFIAGIPKYRDSICWDGLVPAFSATMQTKADATFARHTFYVNRIHSVEFKSLYPNDIGLLNVRDSKQPTQDPVFRLVYGYLHDSDYFADGRIPSHEQILRDDEMDEDEIATRLKNVTTHGGLFVQIIEPTAASTNALPSAIVYKTGVFKSDKLIKSLTNVMSGKSIDIVRKNGDNGEGRKNGLEMLLADIPEGEYDVAFNAPSDNPQGYSFSNRRVKIHGGGVTMIRVRPWEAVARSVSDFADDRGRSFTLVTTNAWLVQAGAAPSEEDLAGCAAAACREGANGYPLAVSAWLGLDPNAATSVLEVVTFGLSSPKTVDLRMATSGRLREAASPSAASTGPVFVPQGRTSLETGWTDLADRIDVPGDKTLWRYPTTSNRFYRITVRPHL